jgi:serine/threonine protein phosphatase PrpC
VADGRVDEDGPWLASLIRQRPDDEPDELYVVVEPASTGSAEYTAQLVEVIAQLYRKDALSLTGALTRSLRAAHEHLLDWNSKSLAEHRIGAGASCLALSGTDAYLAQAGPSLAYVRKADGAFKRLQPEALDFEHSLGLAEDFVPHLTRIALEPGDLVVIASSSLDAIAPQDHIERALSRDADGVLPEFYLLCKDTPNLAFVLLSCFEEPLDTPPDFLTHDSGATEAQASLDDQPPVAISNVLVESAVGAGPQTAEASLAASAPMDDWVLPPRPIKDQVDEIKESAAPLQPPGVAIRGGGSNIRYKKTTGPAIPLPQFQIPKPAIVAAIVLVLVGLVAYWQFPGSLQESREDKFVALVAGAREANARAQATSDAGLKRTMLADARAKLDDAAKIHDDSPEVQSLQSDVTSALNVLNAVYEAKDATIITDLAQTVTGDLAAIEIALGGDATYVLDAEGGRVLRVPIAGGAPETVLDSGMQVNLVTASRPMHISWSEQTQGLVILDDQRQSFVYFPQQDGVLPLLVRDADGLGSTDAISAAADNLYILDRAQNQVWRYYPGQGGFDSERTALLDGADLSNATELAVARDVYVLDSKAGVRRFVLKAEGAFPLAGIDTPAVAPASLSVLPGSNRIVFADTGNKRIIVATDDGRFIRQIVSPGFTDLRGVAVDEGARIMYILNGDTVLKATFPP